ncbi:MAG: hypothetical protein HYR56_25015 [Acidobacteria bacterium]|nr:hypothetical protein [Acidobacteriota bacterium]MBI3424121.1 hypothetical protein [Acidobacteriota bacterium]
MTASGVEAPGDLCVITAAVIEFKTVAKLLSADAPISEDGLQVLRGRYGAQKVTLLKTEIGAVGFAEKLQAHLAQNHYAALLVIGLAGALDPRLRTGDVVLYDRCLDGRKLEAAWRAGKLEGFLINEQDGIPCNERLGQKLFERCSERGLPSQRVAGLLVERVIIEAQQKRALFERTQAATVDMETYLVWAAAAEFHLPCAAVRVVMDEAASDLPDFNAGLNRTGQWRLWPMLHVLLVRPRVTFQFLRTLRPALQSLTQVSRVVFSLLSSR